MKHTNWEDRFIFGARDYWYVRLHGLEAGYFSRLSRAHAYVRGI